MKFSIEKTMEYLSITLGFILFFQGMIFLNDYSKSEEIVDMQMLSKACQFGFMGLFWGIFGICVYIGHRRDRLEKRIEKLEESSIKDHEDGPYISFLREIFRKEKKEMKPLNIQCVWGIFIISVFMGCLYIMGGFDMWYNYKDELFAPIGLMFMMGGFFVWVALCMLEIIMNRKESNASCQV